MSNKANNNQGHGALAPASGDGALQALADEAGARRAASISDAEREMIEDAGLVDEIVDGGDTGSASRAPFDRDEEDAADLELLDSEDWTPRSQLDAPEPREGYHQRWIRMSLLSVGGGIDAGNMAYQIEQQGWQPRRVSTLNESDMRKFPRLAHERYGDIIVHKELVLCEMRSARRAQRQKYYDAKSRRQTNSLEQQVARANDGAGSGFGNMHVAERTGRVTTRKPIVAAD